MMIAELFNQQNQKHYVKASTALLQKIIEEFSYEELLKPVCDAQDDKCYRVDIAPNQYYQFHAIKRIFRNFDIISGSVVKCINGKVNPALDAIEFVIDTLALTGIDPITAAHFIKELNNTLYADMHIRLKLESSGISAKEIYHKPYADIEGDMHGHPWFVINKGRIGFNAKDYAQYAPEMQQVQKLHYLAVVKEKVNFSAVSQMCYQDILKHELSDDLQMQFKGKLIKQGLNPDLYVFVPVHQWQWQNVILQQFSCMLAKNEVVYLGESDDNYLAMQSIRTFANITDSSKYSVKLALSILNTAVYRGLPKKQTQVAPLLTEWVQTIAKNDVFLSQNCRFILLGELASIYVKHPFYGDFDGAPYQFAEQLGVIWRESITSKLKTHEKAITMASLVHQDQYGNALVGEIIKHSGIDVDDWLSAYFASTMPPLLHFLYRYGMVFSPHGENSILILNNGLPVGLAMKDFVDDINICQNPVPELASLPLSVKAAIPQVEDDYLLQFIQTGLFVVHYRYLSEILSNKLHYPEIQFYQKLHQCIANYQKQHPELKERFKRFDLYQPHYAKLCLNRLRVIEEGYGDAKSRPKVLPTDQLVNPLYLAKAYEGACKQYTKGRVSLRALHLSQDLDKLHCWMNEPHVAKHWRLAKSKIELSRHFCQALSMGHQQLFIISVDNVEIGYAEIYKACADRIAQYYPVDELDYGWHVLIGKSHVIGQGYGHLIVQALTAYCFDQLSADRVLCEPDVSVVALEKIAVRLGYKKYGQIQLPEKTAYVFICVADKFKQNDKAQVINAIDETNAESVEKTEKTEKEVLI